jgi:SAM-dependent methyltransferase
VQVTPDNFNTLPPNKDPMGTAILDYLNGQPTEDITVHCSAADDDVIPVEHLFRTYDTMSRLERTAVENCRGHVLDIGAGSGCHSLALYNRGFKVTSIDISPNGVKAMQQQGLPDVRLLNIYDLKGERFDTLLLMMNGIGIVGNLEGFDRFLDHARNLLNPSGTIIFDTSDIEYLFMEEDGSRYINLNDYYYGEVTYQMEYKQVVGEPFPWLYLDYITLTDHCIDKGYDLQLLYDDERFNYLVQLRPISEFENSKMMEL